MSIKHDSDTDLWEEYPVDDRPLPDPGTVSRPSKRVPAIVLVRAVMLVLVAACVIAVLIPKGGDSVTPEASQPETSEPLALPFIDDPAPEPATTIPASGVRWPDDFGWEMTGDAYYSGCLPGSDSSLPDGVWFGYVTGIDALTIEFDLACHYGIEELDGLDSPFIENADKSRRTLQFAYAAEIYTFQDDEPIGPLGANDYMVTGWDDGLSAAVITIAAGEVTEIRHQPAAG